MQNFVNRARAPSPSKAPNSERARKAAQAKVQPGAAALRNKQQEHQNSSARRQSGSTINPQGAPLPNPSQRRSGEGLAQHDRYDTDAESLDTTTHGQSAIKLEDSHENRRHQPVVIKDDDGSSDLDEGSDPEAQKDLDTYDFDQLVDYEHLQNQSRGEQETLLRQKGYKWFGMSNSYPSTTSGLPDGFPDNWTIGGEAPSEGNGRVAPPFQRPISRTSAHQPDPRYLKREPQLNQPRNIMPKQASYLHKSAELRQEERATANLAVRGGASYHQINNLPSSGQLPTSNQANRDFVTQREVVPHRGPRAPDSTPGHAAFQPASRLLPTQPATQAFSRQERPAETAAHVVRPAQAASTREYGVQHRPATPDASDSGPLEDYDAPALFEKTYDELKAEDFDTVPRGQPEVLPEDVARRPLADRLSHVRQHLDSGDQEKFFRGLPTREWEEAGDWFLDQFSSIIARTKEIRQKKRKLASVFEDEVEKRYRQVAKRQQNVNDALNKMKQQGESLVPKSPRPTKTPKKK